MNRRKLVTSHLRLVAAMGYRGYIACRTISKCRHDAGGDAWNAASVGYMVDPRRDTRIHPAFLVVRNGHQAAQKKLFFNLRRLRLKSRLRKGT